MAMDVIVLSAEGVSSGTLNDDDSITVRPAPLFDVDYWRDANDPESLVHEPGHTADEVHALLQLCPPQALITLYPRAQ